MRDWRTLPKASFQGIEFYIETETLTEAGRKVAIHEYAKSEDHSTEDMGSKTKRFRFDAYIASDTADVSAQALIQRLSTAGNGTLVLPMLGTYTAKCTGAEASAESSKQGYIKLVLNFVESGNNSAFSVVALGDRIAASMQSTMAAAIVTVIDAFAG